MRRWSIALITFLFIAACGGSGKSAGGTTPSGDGTGQDGAKASPFASKSWRNALPGGAQAVIGADVAQVYNSAFGQIFIQGMTAQDPGMVDQLRQTAVACKFDFPADLDTMVVAAYPGEQFLAMGTGNFDDAKIQACMSQMATSAGAKLEPKELAKHRVYEASSGSARVWVTVPVAGVMVIASGQEVLEAALTPETARIAAENSELTSRLASVPQDRSAWGAGIVPRDSELAGVVMAMVGDQISAPMSAIYGSAALNEGMQANISLAMQNDVDAKALVDRAKQQLSILRLGLEQEGMGFLLDRLTLKPEAAIVQVQLALTAEDVKLIQSRIGQ